jgi:methionyl-tRNA formyltransferase
MIDLYLMTQKGFEILKFLIQNNYVSHIRNVVAGKDSKLNHDYYEEIVSLCQSNNICVYDRGSTVNDKAEFSVAISWRWIIKDVKTLIVLHDSLLPKYRGFAPLVNSLKNGENKIGVTALYAVEDYDKGDLIFQSSQPIEYPISIQEAIDKITINYIEVIEYIFKRYKEGETISSWKQNDDEASYSLWLDDEDYHIDWSQSSHFIKRFIDATGSPYAGAYSFVGNEKIRVLEAMVEPDVSIENRKEGKIIFFKDGFPVVVCGVGLIRLTKIVTDSIGSNALPLKNFRIRFQ